MLRRAKSILGTNEFTALYDKGYHTGSEFEIGSGSWALKPWLPFRMLPATTMLQTHCTMWKISPIPRKRDSYTCPQGAELKTNGSWYDKEGLAVQAI